MAYTLYIRPVLIPILASAFITGGAFTAALRSQPGFENRPMNQQDMGNPDALEHGPAYSPDNTYGSGPAPDWVIGFSHIFKPEYYHQPDASTYEPYQGVAFNEPAPLLAPQLVAPQTLAAQPVADSAAQPRQVIIADDEGRRQIDDLAHRTDPAPVFRKPLAERPALDRPVEFDDADRAEDTDVDNTRQVATIL